MMTLWRALSSSVGKKLLVSLTGLAMVAFLVGHLAGNLLILVDPMTFNEYGHALTSNPLLIPIEIGLVAIFLTHVVSTIRLTRANRRARPIDYAKKERAGGASRKTLASSTMIYSGMVIAVFLVIHIRTFKFGTFYESAERAGLRDLHRLVVESFANPLYTGFYVVAMVVLAFHLRHGISSAFQSLGADHPQLTPRVLVVGKIAAFVLGLGFAAIPVILFVTGGGK